MSAIVEALEHGWEGQPPGLHARAAATLLSHSVSMQGEEGEEGPQEASSQAISATTDGDDNSEGYADALSYLYDPSPVGVQACSQGPLS